VHGKKEQHHDGFIEQWKIERVTALFTRLCSYPMYIILINSPTPIPIKRQSLGNDVCLLLLSSGCAYSLPPLVDNITDTLYWLQDFNSPVHL
jgi:hypothetical protein